MRFGLEVQCTKQQKPQSSLRSILFLMNPKTHNPQLSASFFDLLGVLPPLLTKPWPKQRQIALKTAQFSLRLWQVPSHVSSLLVTGFLAWKYRAQNNKTSILLAQRSFFSGNEIASSVIIRLILQPSHHKMRFWRFPHFSLTFQRQNVGLSSFKSHRNFPFFLRLWHGVPSHVSSVLATGFWGTKVFAKHHKIAQ